VTGSAAPWIARRTHFLQPNAIRPEHKAYVDTEAEQLGHAGPLLTDDGPTPAGNRKADTYSDSPPQFGQCSRSISKTRFTSRA
jgi:hypothetical protein